MDLVKRRTFSNSVFGKVILVAIILISVTFIGYMLGQFAWYLSK
jgi:hypothetical protein